MSGAGTAGWLPWSSSGVALVASEKGAALLRTSTRQETRPLDPDP